MRFIFPQNKVQSTKINKKQMTKQNWAIHTFLFVCMINLVDVCKFCWHFYNTRNLIHCRWECTLSYTFRGLVTFQFLKIHCWIQKQLPQKHFTLKLKFTPTHSLSTQSQKKEQRCFNHHVRYYSSNVFLKIPLLQLFIVELLLRISFAFQLTCNNF